MSFAVLFGLRFSSFNDQVMPSDSLKLSKQTVKICMRKLIPVSLTRKCRMTSEHKKKRYVHLHMGGAVHSDKMMQNATIYLFDDIA